MLTSKTSSLSRFTQKIAAVAGAALITACGDATTQPEMAPTTFVNIVVSCDVAVAHEAGQWRVNYCTLSLDGLIGSSLILPGEASETRRTALMKFGTCANKRTATEQKACFVMLED